MTTWKQDAQRRRGSPPSPVRGRRDRRGGMAVNSERQARLEAGRERRAALHPPLVPCSRCNGSGSEPMVSERSVPAPGEAAALDAYWEAIRGGYTIQGAVRAAVKAATAVLRETCEQDRRSGAMGAREDLGRLVRETWVKWASEQSDPKPSWLTGWDELDEGQREVDCRIGEAAAAAGKERAEALIQKRDDEIARLRAQLLDGSPTALSGAQGRRYEHPYVI